MANQDLPNKNNRLMRTQGLCFLCWIWLEENAPCSQHQVWDDSVPSEQRCSPSHESSPMATGQDLRV